MRVLPISANNRISQSKSCKSNPEQGQEIDGGKKLSFKGIIQNFTIGRNLKKRYDMSTSFGFNSFVAECTEKTANIFNSIWGHRYLPNSVDFVSFSKRFGEGREALGVHITDDIEKGKNHVYFNSDCDCFRTKDKLEFNEMTQKFLWWHPTGHYLQTFVHEFGHSAHYKHLCERGNEESMDVLREMRIPTIIGRFVAKFNLGRYAATNMNEFMAERITKDVCNNLNSNDVFNGRRKDLYYGKAFSDKWSYRYGSPQAYLDYYTQQVWNGDIREAENAAGEMEIYLEKIKAKEALPVVEKVVETAKETKISWLSDFADSLLGFNKKVTAASDRRNQLRLQLKY